MRLVPLALAILLAAAAWSYYPVARTHYQAQREKEALEAELVQAKERNDRLREEVGRLKTPAGVEEVARESLGLVKEGENLYVVVDTTPTVSPMQPESIGQSMTPQESDGWLRRLLDAVFGFEG